MTYCSKKTGAKSMMTNMYESSLTISVESSSGFEEEEANAALNTTV